MKILIVGDDTSVAESTADLLRFEGHEVEVVAHARAALARAAGAPYDVLIASADLPDILTFWRALRAEIAPLARRLVVLCASENEQVQAVHRESGAVLLPMPYTLRELDEAIRLARQRPA